MKRSLLALMIMAIMVLSGCQDNSQGTTTAAFIGGTKGLDLKFTENQPPEKVMDNAQDTFGIAITMKNEGESTIDTGKVIGTLSGIDATAFSLKSISAQSQNSISAKEKQGSDTIDGGTEILEFGDVTYTPKVTGDFQTTLIADVCYDYETQAVFSLCLKKNTVQKESNKEACKIEALKTEENSGAPVQIGNVRESAAGNNKIKFTFDIEKIGDGKVYKQDTFSVGSGCVENKDTDEGKNKVMVTIEPQSDLVVSCSRLNGGSQGQTQLYENNKGTLVCEIDTSNLQDTAYSSQMTIKVKYTYKDSIQQDIVVKKS